MQHIVETYGESGFHKLLQAYGEGLTDELALKEAIGVGWPQLQTSFDALVAREYDAPLAALKGPELKEKPTPEQLKKLVADNPGSVEVQMLYGQSLQAAGDLDGAMAAYEKAADACCRAPAGKATRTRSSPGWRCSRRTTTAPCARSKPC